MRFAAAERLLTAAVIEAAVDLVAVAGIESVAADIGRSVAGIDKAAGIGKVADKQAGRHIESAAVQRTAAVHTLAGTRDIAAA